jgi:hypothetical protein
VGCHQKAVAEPTESVPIENEPTESARVFRR